MQPAGVRVPTTGAAASAPSVQDELPRSRRDCGCGHGAMGATLLGHLLTSVVGATFDPLGDPGPRARPPPAVGAHRRYRIETWASMPSSWTLVHIGAPVALPWGKVTGLAWWSMVTSARA